MVRSKPAAGADLRLEDFGACDVEPVQLFAEDGAVSSGNLYTPRGARNGIGVHLMHPRSNQLYNYSIPPLLRAGCTVLARGGRWVNNDVNTVHERLLLDVADGVRLLRERGCDPVILLGNSGGAPLSAMYQWQARTAPADRLADTAAGDPAGLQGADLPAADGLAFIGGHLGEATALAKRIDPSVTDEADPFSCDPALDMYSPANGFQPLPKESRYPADFVTGYRAAQIERIRGIDAAARRSIDGRRAADDEFAATGSPEAERRASFSQPVVVYRTMADPAYVDLSIDPDDRRIGTYVNHPRPDLQNYGGSGRGSGSGAGSALVKFLTPEAWLSTWSSLTSRAETIDSVRHISDPLLIVHYAGDSVTTLREIRSVYDAAASPKKDLEIVRGADHFGYVRNGDGSIRGRTAEGTDLLVSWALGTFTGSR
jgi:hypothetical protein